MRRVLPVAILSALLTVMPAALAQRGGPAGHAGAGGFHGGYSGFHGGFSGYGGYHGGVPAPSFGQFVGSAPRIYGAAPHAFSTAPQYGMTAGRLPVYRPAYRPGYPSTYRPTYRAATRPGAGTERRGWDRRDRDRDHRRGYGGYAYPYAYANSWDLAPWDLGYPDFNGYDEDQGAAQPVSQTEQQPEFEQPPDTSYRENYRPAGYERAAEPAPAPIAPEPQLTLIFKDGHTQQIRNYALTQGALLDLDQAGSGRVARIPLASLNLPATEKGARQAGLDFEPPTS
jgi:hypothetical protein